LLIVKNETTLNVQTSLHIPLSVNHQKDKSKTIRYFSGIAKLYRKANGSTPNAGRHIEHGHLKADFTKRYQGYQKPFWS